MQGGTLPHDDFSAADCSVNLLGMKPSDKVRREGLRQGTTEGFEVALGHTIAGKWP